MDAFLAVLQGVQVTVLVTVSSFVIGAVLGVTLVLGLRSSNAAVRFGCRSLVNVLRGIPPVVWLFVLFFGMSIGALRFEPISAAIFGLGLISAGYLAEIYRGGISAVHQGQWEARQAPGVSAWTTFSRVIGPQAFRDSLPAMTSYGVGLLKDSSIAATIGAGAWPSWPDSPPEPRAA